MEYLKVIKDNSFIGVGTNYDLRVWQSRNWVLLIANVSAAEYIQINDVLYHDEWMKIPKNTALAYETAAVIEIDEHEYGLLVEAIDSGEEIEIEDEPPVEEEIIEEPDDPVGEITLEYARNKKLKEIDNVCSNVIKNGFDLEMDDGEIHHFSLTEQDQLNLITLSTQVAAGMTSIPYHADGELCKFFNVNEVTRLLTKATEFKTYHITYYNMLKSYVKQLDSIDDIGNVYYGMELGEEYYSDVMRYLKSLEHDSI